MATVSRKELLKREDAFTEAADKGAVWLANHRPWLVALVGVLVLIAAGVWGSTAYFRRRDAAVAAQFAAGWEIFDEGIVDDPQHDKAVKDAKARADKTDEERDKDDAEAEKRARLPHFADEKAKLLAAQAKLTEVVDQAGYRGVGALAALVLADIQVKLEDPEAAEKAFVTLQQHMDAKDPLSFVVAERLAYWREDRNDPDGALAALASLAQDDTTFYADYAQVHQARLYVAKHDPERARTILEHVEKSFPNSSLLDDVRAKLEHLALSGPPGEPAAPPAAPPAP